MENINIKTPSKDDIKQIALYYGKTFLYSLLIGSSVVAIAKNYKKAMLNEEIFAMYKYFRTMQGAEDLEDFKH